MNMTNEEYNEYIKKKQPRSPLGMDMLRAFLVGGLICAGLALARQTDAGAVLDTGGNVDLEVLFLPGPASTVTDLAGVLDDTAGAVAGRTGPLDHEEALLRTDLAHAVASLAGGGAIAAARAAEPSSCRSHYIEYSARPRNNYQNRSSCRRAEPD